MKTELKENGRIPAHILWTLAIVAGISVANLYYNQPLLNLMRDDLDTTDFRANLIAMVTQGGYALGLLFIVPLGDLFHRKKIILLNFAVLVAALCAMAAARNIYTVWGAPRNIHGRNTRGAMSGWSSPACSPASWPQG